MVSRPNALWAAPPISTPRRPSSQRWARADSRVLCRRQRMRRLVGSRPARRPTRMRWRAMRAILAAPWSSPSVTPPTRSTSSWRSCAARASRVWPTCAATRARAARPGSGARRWPRRCARRGSRTTTSRRWAGAGRSCPARPTAAGRSRPSRATPTTWRRRSSRPGGPSSRPWPRSGPQRSCARRRRGGAATGGWSPTRWSCDGHPVRHIGPDGGLTDHALTDFAVVEGGTITYPPAQTELV